MKFDEKVFEQKLFFHELFPLIKGPGRAHTGPYGPEKSQKLRKEIVLIGAFKGPVTLP